MKKTSLLLITLLTSTYTLGSTATDLTTLPDFVGNVQQAKVLKFEFSTPPQESLLCTTLVYVNTEYLNVIVNMAQGVTKEQVNEANVLNELRELINRTREDLKEIKIKDIIYRH